MAFAYLDGQTWREIDGPFTLNGLGYPYNWPDLATKAQRTAAGVVAIVEADTTPPPGKVLSGLVVTDVGGVPTRTPIFANAPVPTQVLAIQGLEQLRRDGRLDAVNAAISSADADHQLWFSRTTVFRRDNAMLIAMWHALGWTDAQLDATFVAATQIPV